MRKLAWLIAIPVALSAIYSCQKELNSDPAVTSEAKKINGTYDVPTITVSSFKQTALNLTVTAGATGAPSGFSIQWMTKAAFDANNGVWPIDTTLFCKASFSGNANLSRYNLGPTESTTIQIGELLMDNGASVQLGCEGELQCGTAYVFRIFAHGDNVKNRSAYGIFGDETSEVASTSSCDVSCTRKGLGAWKDSFADWGYTDAYDLNFMTLGDHSYSANQIYSILTAQPQGNGLIALAHQLITAKLNGAPASVTADADAAFNGMIVPPVGTSSVKGGVVAGLVAGLNSFNLCP
jgi:hypothetical protein